MIRLGGGSDCFGAVGHAGGGHGAWPQRGWWFEQRPPQVLGAAPRPATTRATGRWTGCTRSAARWRRRSSAKSRTCSTWRWDLLFFDTTSTCFELDEEDEPCRGTRTAR